MGRPHLPTLADIERRQAELLALLSKHQPEQPTQPPDSEPYFPSSANRASPPEASRTPPPRPAANPNLGEAHATLAQALQRSGQREETKKELAELQRINDAKDHQGQAMILVETAEGHIKKGELGTAVAELQEAITLSPDFTEAHYQLGLALRQFPDASDKAETAFQRVLQLNPNHAAAYLQLGQLSQSRGDLAQASSQFEKAIQLAPGLVEAHLRWGQLANDTRDWTTAVREFWAALAWNSENADAHYGLALALKASGHPEEAAHELQLAQKLKPALAAPH